MKKRHVFATPDVATAKAVVQAARDQGVGPRCITVEARKDIELRHVSDQRKNVSMDFIPAALRGTVLGAVAGLLLGLVASWMPGFDLHGLGVLALGGVGALIGTWASVLVGASLPDEVRRTFEHEIEQGRILVVVDGEPGLLEQVDPAVARAGGVRLPYEATTALT